MLDSDSDDSTQPLQSENVSSEYHAENVCYLTDDDVLSDQENRTQERSRQILTNSLSVSSLDGSIHNTSENGPDSPDPPDLNVNVNADPGGEWHPFRSRVHCQLVLLYQSSHRRNVDQITFRAFMEILKVSFHY